MIAATVTEIIAKQNRNKGLRNPPSVPPVRHRPNAILLGARLVQNGMLDRVSGRRGGCPDPLYSEMAFNSLDDS